MALGTSPMTTVHLAVMCLREYSVHVQARRRQLLKIASASTMTSKLKRSPLGLSVISVVEVVQPASKFLVARASPSACESARQGWSSSSIRT
jgi:hypothetical protein